ncbi:MAG: D-aminoacylase [Acidobacteriota bacterium]
MKILNRACPSLRLAGIRTPMKAFSINLWRTPFLCLMAGVATVLATQLVACSPPLPAPEYDLIILNGRVVDGSGQPAVTADVAVKDDLIARVGQLQAEEKKARRVIDARGLVVSPGFIDIHSHSDYTLLVDGTAQSKIRQGVTTEILGEAPSAAPIKGKASLDLSQYQVQVDWQTFREYFARLKRQGISVNVGSYVGATQVRTCVMGLENRAPTASEMEEMKDLVVEAMKDGALGLSSSLIVPPDTYLTTRQLIELAKAVKPFKGIYSTHVRGEGDTILEAVAEAIQIGQEAGVPVDVIHLKIADKRKWGRMKEVCDLIEKARQNGVSVTANQYPYVAGQNYLLALIPPWALEGGQPKLMDRLRKPSLRSRMRRDIQQGVPGWFNHYRLMPGWESAVVATVQTEQNKPYEGKSVAEIAELTGKDPFDVVFDLLLEENDPVPTVYFMMSEDDVRYAMSVPWVSIGSDGEAVRPDGILGKGRPHPRWYGTFPRVLGRYVREETVLSLELAVRKMTALNAEKLGIEDRGLLQKGKKADITIFDPNRVIDKATFENPHQYPEGIAYVVVNGTLVLDRGRHLESKPGQIIHGRGKS